MKSMQDQILKQALEAFRDGDARQARELIEQVLENDDTNARAWLLLYRISDNLDEKRAALKNVLENEPDNEKARTALQRLNARMGIEESDDEVAPGVSRRLLLIIAGGIGLVALLALVAVVMVIMNNSRAQAEVSATQTAFAIAPTLTVAAQEAVAFAATQESVSATETQVALVSPTPTLTETPEGLILPPTFTLTPSPTPIITPTPLDPPPGIGGVIYGWGGVDLINDGYFRVITARVDGGGQVVEIPSAGRGRYVSAVIPQELVYNRFVTDQFLQDLYVVDSSTGVVGPLAERWFGIENLFDTATMPHHSVDGRQVAFVALSLDNGSYDVYIYDANITTGNPVRRITSDDRDYSYPAFSPDSNRLIVTRKDATSFNQDLYLIDLVSLQQTPFTTDGDAVYEEMARFSPDGQIVAYVARTTPNGDGDIVIRPVTGITGALNITNSAGDDIHPVFSPDGRYIAFASTQRATAHQIYIYDGQTGAIYQLTTEPLASYYPGAWLDR